ncbi:MAG: NAD(P)-binding protein [Pseudomonadota bacterium]
MTSGGDKNIVIVGGGVAGLFTALRFLDRGYNPIIVDQADAPAKFWRSYECETPVGRQTFDKGLRILMTSGRENVDALYYDAFKTLDWREVNTFINEGAVFNGALYKENSCIDVRSLGDDICAAIISELRERGRCDAPDCPNALEKIETDYGPTLRAHVFEPVLKRYFGRPLEDLAPNAHRLLIPKRFIVASEDIETLREKNDLASKVAHLSVRGMKDPFGRRFLYPSRGSGEWIDAMTSAILERGGKFLLNRSIASLEVTKGAVDRLDFTEGDGIDVSHLFWTAPPALFLKAAGVSLAGAPPEFLSITTANIILDRPLPHDLIYIADYDVHGSFYRTMFYSNFRKAERTPETPAIAIELIGEVGEDFEAKTEKALSQLRRMGGVQDSATPLFIDYVNHKNALPRPTVQFQKNAGNAQAKARDLFDNVAFAGRASGAAIFLDSVASTSYEAVDDAIESWF